MPFPVLAGLPWLAGIIGAMFTAIFSWFLQYVTRRFAIVLAVVSVIALVTVAFFSAINALILALEVTLPTQLFAAFSLVLPSNTTICLTAVVSAHLLRWVYSWQVRILQYKLF